MKRPTIGDIARRAGLSKAAVSYALNGRPGVSEETRERVSRIAHALGWRANIAALALSSERVGVAGLVVAGEVPWPTVEGIERELAGDGVALQVAIAKDAEETYQDWWASGRVDGMLLIDPRPDDPRIPLLHKLGVPTALIGASHPGMSAVLHDRTGACEQVTRHLAERGHTRIGHVAAGPDEAIAATRDLEDVTAVIYDDPMAAAKVVSTSGIRVPDDLAVVAWHDSPVCRLVNPEITAIRHDHAADGALAARLLLNLLSTGVPEQRETGLDELVVRGTT
ncbi:LacI family DNA-binding transcriptional regulator [Kibdelosporangium persicum]|uniref:DNA-binding transcriptional regulator, LacI/PurR family n=1 Tax=Kibdelosporangium persicum TaxID=2698649 RepID=A0ABX2FGJ5_9PSEU|nr:LacI family DNA-binding transcriptional regulator [Kibdelosporangium persicum]NRN70526.1 DNA-binding transcriptional regulator, LacI/PurR family [Kibdelosporangium persicum]